MRHGNASAMKFMLKQLFMFGYIRKPYQVEKLSILGTPPNVLITFSPLSYPVYPNFIHYMKLPFFSYVLGTGLALHTKLKL